MTSRQHQDWINRGKPDSGLALPLQLLANTLAAAGYTVYVYPNDAHLDAEPPEDHCYYAETGWPHASPKWWRHAIDIMPPPAGKNLPSLQQLGQSIFNARQAGQITWLKYMNWPSDGNLNRAVQDRWEPNHSRGPSGDTGHIHLSSVTGVETLDSSYNPLTHVVVASSTTSGATMSHTIDDVYTLLSRALNGFTDKGAVSENLLGAWVGGFQSANNAHSAQLAAIAAKVGAPAQVTLSPDQLATITAAIVAHPANPLTDADKPVIEAAVSAAFAKAFPAA